MIATPKDLRAAKYKDAQGTTQGIPVGLVNEMLALKAYVKLRNSSTEITERILGNYEKVTQDDMDNVKRQVIFHTSSGDFQYDPNTITMEPVQIIPQPTTATSPSPNLPHPRSGVAEFDRGVKRDKGAFTKLTDLSKTKQWLRNNTKTARAQGVYEVFDETYVPTNPDDIAVFRKKLDFMDDVLNSTWELTAGREIIHDQGDSPDAQKAIIKLREIDAKSVSAGNRASDIMKTFSSIKFGDPQVKGNTKDFLSFVHELFRQYNELIEVPEDRLSNNMQSNHMKIAVNNCPELQNVSSIQDAIVAQRPGTKYTYEQYYQSLTHTAERRDANALKEHGISVVSKRKVYLTEFGAPYQVDNYDSVNEVLAEMILYKANAHARMNDNGQVRMDIKSWNSISPEGKLLWDTMSEKDKGTILSVIADASSTPPSRSPGFTSRTPRPPLPRTAALHAQLANMDGISERQYVACLQALTLSDATNGHGTMSAADHFDAYLVQSELEQGHSLSTRQPGERDAYASRTTMSQPDHRAAAQLRAMKTQREKAAMDAVPASDPRKMMSLTYGKEPPKVTFQDPSAPSDEVTIGGHKYYRKASMHQRSPTRNVYEVSHHKKLQQHAMVDRGANGIVSGNDVRVIEYLDGPPVDVAGIDSHQINDVPLATVGAVMMSITGPIIGIFFQAAHHGKGRTILSSPQLEAFGNIVDDRSIHVGGTQRITTPDGIVIPIDIVDNLPYTPMRAYTDDDWDTLPIFMMTQYEWKPNALDCILSDKKDWCNAISDLQKDFTSSVFDTQESYKLQTTAQTERYSSDAAKLQPMVNLEDVFDGENATEFITTMQDSPRKAEEMMNSGVKDAPIPPSTHGETVHGETTSVSQFPPSDLADQTFLMNKQEDGQRFRAKIAEAIEDAKETPLTHGETVPGETTPVYLMNIEQHENEHAKELPLTHGETAHGETTPVFQFHPSDLVGRTFLMNKQETGQRFRAWIVEAIQQHENEPAKEPKLHKFRILYKFRVLVNGDQYKEIWILKFMKQNQNNKEQRSVGHQGPVCLSDHSCNGSRWSTMIKCETRMVQAELLLIMINPTSSMKIIGYYHIVGSETNPSDVLSKHLWHFQVWPLVLQRVLFWKGNTADLLGVQEE
jgi:hypothetical protein